MMCNYDSGIGIGIGFRGFSGSVELELKLLQTVVGIGILTQFEHRLSVLVKHRTDKISVIGNWLSHILIASSSRYYTRIFSLLDEESNHTETGMCEYG